MNLVPFLVVLPARYHSTRFPGKPLAQVAGRPLIEWVYRRAERIRGAGEVVVATDDERIERAVELFGGRVVVTSPEHRTGSDRVAEVARALDYEVVVNLQGDEPIIPVGMVEEMVDIMGSSVDTDIVTACHPIERAEDMGNPNVVKVVADRSHRALYFSRSPIPYRGWGASPEGVISYRHIGLYVFRRSSLLAFSELAPSKLEEAEGLEQLRALENGMSIRLFISEKPTVGVDVPGDIKKVEKEIARNYTLSTD